MLLRSNSSSFPHYFRYISNVKSAITYKFVKSGCSNYFFLNSENLICQGTDISKCVRESLGIRDNESQLYLLFISPYFGASGRLYSGLQHFLGYFNRVVAYFILL